VADSDRVPPGGYDICGPERTTYRRLLFGYARATGTWRAGLPIRGIDTALVARVTAVALPVPGGLAIELVNLVPGPVAGVLRTGIDILADLTPNGKSA
jgi:hypothetical protein